MPSHVTTPDTTARRRGLTLLVIAALGLPLPAFALSSDRNKPMHIEADRAELDDRKGKSTYWGNVQVTQGTMKLTAKQLTVYVKDSRIIKVIAQGKPAHFQQRPDGQKEDVQANAERIEYYENKNKLVLNGNARVWQAGNVFNSDRIEYDMKRNIVNAGGETSEITGDQRVRITIQPNHKPDKEPAEQ